MDLSRQTMLDRMLHSDAAYNGRFLTGVVTTGIFCLPSCRARKPKPENVKFFARPEEAEAAGLRPCKRCRPDLFYRDCDPDRLLVEDLVARLRADPAAFGNVGDLVRDSGVGSSKLNELFRRHYHTTPAEMIGHERIERACRELVTTRRPIADIGFDVGYETLSAFNENFRERTRMSPRSYRRLAAAERFEIELPAWFQARRVLAYLGRDPASLTEVVEGDVLRFAIDADGGPVSVAAAVGPGKARCRLEPSGAMAPGCGRAVHRLLLRLLGLTIDPQPFERRMRRSTEHARLIAGRRGLTIPQTRDVVDALVWVVVGQQISLPVALALRRRLTGLAGTRVSDRLFVPPTADALARLDQAELEAIGFSRRKAEYLLGIARAVVAGALDPQGLRERTATEIERKLLEVRGLGPWSVHYLMMRALALADCVPLGDVALAKSLMQFFDLPERPRGPQTIELMQPFSPYRSLATFHLWTRLGDVQ